MTRFVNTNPEDAKTQSWSKLSLPYESRGRQSFVRSNSFRQGLTTTFAPEMDGLDTFAILFQSRNAKNLTLYNDWNFTRTYEWDSLTNDSFWYSDQTMMLFETEKFRIGTEALESIVIDLQPTQRIWKGQNYTSKLLGIFPMGAGDLVERAITWLKFSDVNLSYRTRKMDPSNFNNSLGGGSNMQV